MIDWTSPEGDHFWWGMSDGIMTVTCKCGNSDISVPASLYDAPEEQTCPDCGRRFIAYSEHILDILVDDKFVKRL